MNEQAHPETVQEPWKALAELLRTRDAQRVRRYLESLGEGETARAVLRLDRQDQNELLTLLEPQQAADVIREVSDRQAVEVMGDLPPTTAAAIVDELPSDEQADLLGEMDRASAEAILKRMDPAEAADATRLMKYDPDTAGGLMVTEYLAFHQDRLVRDVLEDLSANREQYGDYDVQYIYVTDGEGKLVGVLRMRDVLFAPAGRALSQVMVRQPVSVPAGTPMENLRTFFDEHHLLGAPVVDSAARLVGVILPEAVEQAGEKRASRQFLKFSGIIAGEEFRTMPLLVRSGRRLSWLTVNIVLNLIAASVIALYQDTVQAAVALAVFLPIISDMSGCSGNQAVAVSIRELTLRLVRPTELLLVLVKEAGVGIVNGLVLGLLLAGVATLWKGNPYFGLVVGLAMAGNTLVSVCLGGVLPLLLKRLRVDPALLSSPILTTVTDTCGFFLVLSVATALLPKLTGA